MDKTLKKILSNNSTVVIPIKIKAFQDILHEWFGEKIKIPDLVNAIDIDYDEEIGKLMLCIDEGIENNTYQKIRRLGFNISEPFLNMEIFLCYIFNDRTNAVSAYVDLESIEDVEFDDIIINIYIPIKFYNEKIKDNKVIINIDGGLVQEVYSNNNSKILIFDSDAEGADQDEFLDKEEINDFIDNQDFKAVENWLSGIYEENLL